jgi:hypothetical protein
LTPTERFLLSIEAAETIELLAGRGEKLTRLLLDFYCPEL